MNTDTVGRNDLAEAVQWQDGLAIPERVTVWWMQNWRSGVSMLNSFGRRLSLLSSGTHKQFAVALALVSVIPLLAIWRVSQTSLDPTGSAWVDTATIALSVWVAVLGYALLAKYPANIARLRTYLEKMAEGEFPEAVALIRTENDIQSIESSLNVILDHLKGRITVVEAEKAEMEKQLYQRERLLLLDRHRVMTESFGSVCHHLGQPMTVITCYLEMMRENKEGIPVREMIDQSLEAVNRVNELLHKFQNLCFYRTEPYLASPANGDSNCEDRIVAINPFAGEVAGVPPMPALRDG
jgi:signal transduction histidine kinase